MTHILVIESVKWVIIGSCYGLLPVRCQAITRTNAGVLSIRPLGTRFSDIGVKIQDFSFKKMHLKMLLLKYRTFCPGSFRWQWVSCQIRKIAGCACARNVSPPPWVNDPDIHHGTCVTHVPWCISESLTSGFLWSRCWENVPGIPGTCVTRNFMYLVRGPWIIRNTHLMLSIYCEVITPLFGTMKSFT